MSIQNPTITYSVAIKQGFPIKIKALFSLGTLDSGVPLDLNLYRVRCGIKRNVELPSLEVIVPSVFVPVPEAGLAILTFSAEQTAQMTVGEWIGNVLIQSIADGDTSHGFDIILDVQRSYAQP
jgi:hypothetical protein